jgi:ABC-type anion transport system duplicated permease subunit
MCCNGVRLSDAENHLTAEIITNITMALAKGYISNLILHKSARIESVEISHYSVGQNVPFVVFLL